MALLVTVPFTHSQHETKTGTAIDGRYDTFTANECNIFFLMSYRDISLVDIAFVSRLPETVCIISDRNGLRNAGNTFHTDIIAVLRYC